MRLLRVTLICLCVTYTCPHVQSRLEPCLLQEMDCTEFGEKVGVRRNKHIYNLTVKSNYGPEQWRFCYAVVHTRSTRQEAQQVCTRGGGRLAGADSFRVRFNLFPGHNNNHDNFWLGYSFEPYEDGDNKTRYNLVENFESCSPRDPDVMPYRYRLYRDHYFDLCYTQLNLRDVELADATICRAKKEQANECDHSVCFKDRQFSKHLKLPFVCETRMKETTRSTLEPVFEPQESGDEKRSSVNVNASVLIFVGVGALFIILVFVTVFVRHKRRKMQQRKEDSIIESLENVQGPANDEHAAAAPLNNAVAPSTDATLSPSNKAQIVSEDITGDTVKDCLTSRTMHSSETLESPESLTYTNEAHTSPDDSTRSSTLKKKSSMDGDFDLGTVTFEEADEGTYKDLPDLKSFKHVINITHSSRTNQ